MINSFMVGFRHAFLLGALFCIAPSIAQDNSGSSNFNLSPNALGALQNSVNLYTGQVAFPMTVASLPGRGGLSPKITINYNSAGVKKTVETWNRERPTGILGLGWSFEFPKIISNHNNTATREDDVFYLAEGGQSVRLICTDKDANGNKNYRTYRTEIYQPWKVQYFYGSEKWVITKDDGILYTYGDATRPAEDGTLQNMIAWDNWIGSSNVRSGQEEVTYIWNLSTVENLWGDAITYYYDNIEEDVGATADPGNPSTPKHTKASVLRKIVGPIGNIIQLNYTMKEYTPCASAGDFRCTGAGREYQDPHVEANEPDAYQEKYEPRYLESIEAFDELGLPIYDVQFTYNENDEEVPWLGEGEFIKRLLTGIEQTNYTGVKLPKTNFTYELGDSPYKGYLMMVENSIGGKITYQYKQTHRVVGRAQEPLTGNYVDLTESQLAEKDLSVSSPGESWTEPNLYMGPNYVVVIWRQNVELEIFGRTFHTTDPRPSYLQIYEWQGEWVKHDMGSIGELRLSTAIDKQELVIALEQNHFAVALRQGNNAYRVNLYHKDKFDGSWESYTDNVTLTDGRLGDANYLSELFLAAGQNYVAFGNVGTTRLHRYTWMNGAWEKDYFQHTSPGGYTFTGSSNYLVVTNTKPRPHDFWLHYLTEDKTWVTADFQPQFTGDGIDTGDRRDWTYWYSTPNFAFTMADDNPEYAYMIGSDYENHTRFTLPGLPDRYAVQTPSNSNINISAYPPGAFEDFNNLYFFRYNGIEWKSKVLEGETFGGLDFSVIGPKLYNNAPDVIGYSVGESRITLANFDANLNDWRGTEFITPVNWLDRYVKVSPRSALMGSKLYYLEPDGQWLEQGEIDYSDLHDSSWDEDLKSANDIYAVSEPYTKTRFYKFMNGQVVTRTLRKNMDKRTSFYDVGDRLLSTGFFAAFDVEDREKAGARQFGLYKWENEDYNGGHRTIVVSNVHVNDGALEISKAYSYEYTTARISAGDEVPFFNVVTVVSGSNDIADRPKGYTKHYFHNGKPLTEIEKVPSLQLDRDVLLFAGSHYRTEMYNTEGTLLTDTETIYATFKQDVTNAAGTNIDQSYFVRPVRSVTSDYLPEGVQTATTLTAYNEHGYPKTVENLSHGSIAKARNKVTYTYYPEVYDETQHNIFSEIVSTRTSVNTETVTANATVWDVISGRPQAVKTYHWRGFDSSVFSSWSGTTPPAQWRLASQIERRDGHGNILASIDYMGDYESAVYDDLMLNPVVSASYADYNQIAATSFEPGQNGRINTGTTSDQEAYTGERCLFNGSASVNNLPNGDYEVYYWYKNNAGTVSISSGNATDMGDQRTSKGWTLRKWQVSGSGTVTINTSGYLDELRIHPKDAYVTTFTYDRRQQKTAETGPDLLTTFYYYDDYERQHYITDHEGNIVLYYEYGFKKEEQ